MSNIQGNNGGRFYSTLIKPILVECNFVVDSSNGNGLGIRSLKGANVRNVFMNTSATPAAGNAGYLNPNPAAGYALIQLKANYGRYAGGFAGFVAPTTGGTIAINSTALTAGNPYIIGSVGHSTLGAATIAPVADVSGSLASTYFKLYDNYGNTFVIWFYVTGVGGSAPVGTGGTLVQQTIPENETAANIGTALVSTIELLPSGIAGVYSFTASGTTTVTVTSTQTHPYQPLPGAPMDGTIATGFTFANTVTNTNNQCWQGCGLMKGINPAVGASFIATSTGVSTGGGSTGLVLAPGVSGVETIEVVGDPNTMIAPVPMGGTPYAGSWFLVQFIKTATVTAPNDNTVVGMSFYMDVSTTTIAGD